MVVEAPAETGTRAEQWRRWLAQLGGRRLDPATYAVTPTLVSRAEAAVTGRPGDEVANAAWEFRPHLRFDRKEPYRPLDVDRFLAEKTERGEAAHTACHRRGEGLADPCVDLAGADGLFPARSRIRVYVDIRGERRYGTDVVADRAPDASEIYYRAKRDGDRLYIQYWWFFPLQSLAGTKRPVLPFRASGFRRPRASTTKATREG